MSFQVDNTEMKEQNAALRATLLQIEEETRAQKTHIKELQALLQQKALQKQDMEQRYSPLVLSGMLDDMAERLHVSLEDQATSFCSNRNAFFSSTVPSSYLLTPSPPGSTSTTSSMSASVAGLDASMLSTTGMAETTQLNPVVEMFISQWRQDRLRYHVYQLKAQNLKNFIASRQQQLQKQAQQAFTGVPYYQAGPELPPQYPNSVPASQQQQPQSQLQPQPSPNPTRTGGFGLKSLFGPWKS